MGVLKFWADNPPPFKKSSFPAEQADKQKKKGHHFCRVSGVGVMGGGTTIFQEYFCGGATIYKRAMLAYQNIIYMHVLWGAPRGRRELGGGGGGASLRSHWKTVERSVKFRGRSIVSQRSRLCGKGVEVSLNFQFPSYSNILSSCMHSISELHGRTGAIMYIRITVFHFVVKYMSYDM